jgi:anti-sigma factor ChrR (cupin superfamily)
MADAITRQTKGDASSVLISVDEVPWEDAQPGVRLKRLWSDQATDRSLMLARIDSEARLRHRRAGQELSFVLEGVLSDGEGRATPGTVVYCPAGCPRTHTSEHGATTLTLFLGGDAEPASGAPDGPPSEIIATHELPWIDARPGMRIKRIWVDPGPVEQRLGIMQYAPGGTMELHRHDGDELIFVLEGSVADEAGVVKTGDVAHRLNGCAHTVTAKNGATVLTFAFGSVQML